MRILLAIVGVLAGAFAAGCLLALIGFIEGCIRGYKMQHFIILFCKWERDYYDKEKPGRIRFSFSTKSALQIIPSILMVPDLKDRADGEKKAGPSVTRESVVLAVIMAMLAIVAFGSALFITIRYSGGKMPGFLMGVLCGVAATFGMFAWIGFSLGSRNGLQSRITELVKPLRDENLMDSFTMPPFAREEYDKAQVGMKRGYAQTYYVVAEIRNDLPAMTEAVRELEALGTTGLTEQGAFHVDTILYSFYSFRKIDPELADKYYRHSKKLIEEDKDCNGRRKLAYYAFYILKDFELARKYALEGLESMTAPDPRMGIVQRNFEEKMLRYLITRLDEEQKS